MNSEMLIKMWPIERPIEYARNARKIGSEQEFVGLSGRVDEHVI